GLFGKYRPVGSRKNVIGTEEIDGTADQDGIEPHRVDIDMPPRQLQCIAPDLRPVTECTGQQDPTDGKRRDDDAKPRQLFECAAFQQSNQRGRIDGAAREHRSTTSIAAEALPELLIVDRMYEYRHAERGCHRKCRAGLGRVEKKISFGAFDENATK